MVVLLVSPLVVVVSRDESRFLDGHFCNYCFEAGIPKVTKTPTLKIFCVSRFAMCLKTLK